ncbi:Mlp family lipoprotein [Borrelia persica]|uniref:Mlp family lipoprotein n=1 Tax=Borrelia persica TaxID=44448 RepID=UPI000466D8A6|nr:Mlp family lipoprotein [Borrelia persica]
MKKISIILILLLLINSCDAYKQKKNSDNKPQRDSEEQIEEAKKTPEEILKEKLNDTEKINLNFLKEALNDEEKFNKFVLFGQSKIKEALEHIKTQLESCNNNDDGKNTFKNVIQGYFNKMDDNTLSGFKEGATSTCGAGG